MGRSIAVRPQHGFYLLWAAMGIAIAVFCGTIVAVGTGVLGYWSPATFIGGAVFGGVWYLYRTVCPAAVLAPRD